MRRSTALAAIAVAVLALAPKRSAAFTFVWTISNSTTDPISNTGPIAPGPTMFVGNLYLWLLCGPVTEGMAAAEFDVVEFRGGGVPTGFTPMNGFLNAGTATELLLAVGGCPTGAVLAGAFSVGSDASIPDIDLCLVHSAANARNITVECDTGRGLLNEVVGFAKTSPSVCTPFNPPCFISVEESSWGKVKSLFR